MKRIENRLKIIEDKISNMEKHTESFVKTYNEHVDNFNSLINCFKLDVPKRKLQKNIALQKQIRKIFNEIDKFVCEDTDYHVHIHRINYEKLKQKYLVEGERVK